VTTRQAIADFRAEHPQLEGGGVRDHPEHGPVFSPEACILFVEWCRDRGYGDPIKASGLKAHVEAFQRRN